MLLLYAFLTCIYCRFLFIRDFHDRHDVLQARRAVLQFVSESGSGKFEEGTSFEEGILQQRCGIGCVPFMEVLSTLCSNLKINL